MAPHQQRVVNEKSDLDGNIERLNAFFDTAIFAGLDDAEKERLEKQVSAMQLYSDILGQRIAAFS